MREPVGKCVLCDKEVHCEDGFLNGVIGEDQKLRCFDCEEKEKKNSPTGSS
ncbi:hypothetical protein [Halobacillus sp. Marseille-Q1614]|uniref:hypothetical protein n=1 Tax=Halobacillus sp. Marseille-Q1614 TaxID=2709134 RepID=UPI00156DC56E|nr:hypothetical protein [Halobacillus sp. Marseille-Q1614]